NEIPPYESRVTTAKLLLESEEFESSVSIIEEWYLQRGTEVAVDVLEGLLEEDDEVVQVWYLSGWVCYLQLEKAKELQEREGREVTEEETEEWKALQEVARSYLTNAKKTLCLGPGSRSTSLELRPGETDLLLLRDQSWGKAVAHTLLYSPGFVTLLLYIKLRCDDQPMSEHVEQLLGDLGGELEGEEEDPFLDEDYEPCSDEEEDAAEAPMEH
ncbi:hypothetical protein KUCAC02_014588, partial [Chaenocephalus aceratus]